MPTGDTWVRSDKPDQKFGNQAQMQMQTYAEGIYSLSGQRLSQPVKGLNIVNGRKVLVK